MHTNFKRPHRMTIEARSASKDSLGGQVDTWAPTVVVWCRIRPLSGDALQTAQQNFGKVSHEIRMLYRSGLTQANRGNYCGRIFDFTAVLNVNEANVETKIMALEGLTQG